MKRKYSPVTKVLVVFSSAVVGYAIALLVNQQVKGFFTCLCIALVTFGIAVAIAYKNHKETLFKKDESLAEVTKDTSDEEAEETVDESEFEEEDIVTEPIYHSVNTPDDEDNSKDVLDEF